MRSAKKKQLILELEEAKTREQLSHDLEAANRLLADYEKLQAAQMRELEQLRSRETYFQAITYNSSDLIFVVNLKGKITYANKAVERILGFRPEEMVGKNAARFIHPDDLERAVRDFFSLIEIHGDVRQNSFRIVHKDGTCRVLEGVGTNLLNDPVVAGFIMNVRDVTERKLTEAALSESEEKFRQIFEKSSDAHLLIDDGVYVDCNDATVRVMGYPDKSRLIGLKPSDIATYEQPDGLKSTHKAKLMIDMALKDGSNRFEWVRKKADGSVMYSDVMLTAIPLRGKTILFTTWRDITERKQMEIALRESEERNWIFTSLSSEGICISKDDLVVDANDTFISMAGYYSLPEITGKNILDMPAPDVNDATMANIRLGLEGTYEISFLKKDGSVFPAEFNIRNIIYQGSNARVITVRDIAERRQAEEALRNSEERYRSLFENSGTAMMIVEDSTVLSLANSEFEKLSGYSKKEIEGMATFTQFVSQKDLQRMIGYHEARRSEHNDAPSEYEFRFVDRDGNEKDVLVKIAVNPGTKQTIAALLDISTLKKTEQRLKESLEFNKTVLAVSPIGIAIFHSSGLCVSVNNAVTEIIGGCTEQVLKQNFRQLASWKECGMLQAAERALSAGQVISLETQLDSTFGKSCYVDCRFAHFYHEDELHLLLLIADINDRILTEKALKESERRLADIIDFLPDATLVINREGTVIAWNRAMEELTGVDSSSMIGKGNYEYALPVHKMRRPILVDLVMNPDPEIEKSCYMLDRKGEVLSAEAYIPLLGKFLSSTAAPLRDSDGKIVGAIQSTHDITEAKRASDELARAEEKYRSIFENAILGIYQTNPVGRILSCNLAFARIAGYGTPEELTASVPNITRIYAEPEVRREFLHSLERTGTAQAEFRIRKKDGSLIWVAAFARAVKDVNGNLLHYEGTAQNINERKVLETQLMQSQKIEAIGTLAGGIAHDFNNILGVIIGFTEMAKSKLTDSGIDRYLENVLKSCDRAKGLITQILTFSRRADQEKRPVDVGIITNESIKLLRATIPTTIEIRLEIPSDLNSVMADPTQIHQVLINLCTNAAHAMRDKGGVLSIALENCELSASAVLNMQLQPGSYVKLTVSDTGAGISREYVHRIFDPFFTTKSKGEGTGLGLSVVYGIVKESGGAITVESEPGKGAAFSVYLPGIENKVSEAPEQKKPIPTGNERILFVDDEDDIARMGYEMLQMLGYQVEAMTSSLSALERFKDSPDSFDLVITDMTMPVMTGADLAKELLKIRADLPIILCTGFSELISEDKAMEMGIRQFINKPVSFPDMAKGIRKALERE